LDTVDVVEPDRRELVHALAGEASKLNDLLTDLLDVDRLSRGILEPKRRPTDLERLARSVVEDMSLQEVVTIDAEAVVVAVDPPMIERIVENLLANATRHTPPGTPVWLRVKAEDAGAVILVEDAGPGVAGELGESVFEPFRQGPSARPHSPGVGIGLALVARFAELHGGKAWVEERPGGGASFRVFLPARAPKQAG
jgi:two-component system sensor histidine kinase KdpD